MAAPAAAGNRSNPFLLPCIDSRTSERSADEICQTIGDVVKSQVPRGRKSCFSELGVSGGTINLYNTLQLAKQRQKRDKEKMQKEPWWLWFKNTKNGENKNANENYLRWTGKVPTLSHYLIPFCFFCILSLCQILKI